MEVDVVVKELAKTLKESLGERILEVILFGSRARDVFELYSDYDVLVLVDKQTKELRDNIREIAHEIGWKHQALVLTIVHEKRTFDERLYEPLFINIRKEGIVV